MIIHNKSLKEFWCVLIPRRKKCVSLDWFCQKWPWTIAYRHAQFCNFIRALLMDMSLYRIQWYHNLLNVNYRPFKNERDPQSTNLFGTRAENRHPWQSVTMVTAKVYLLHRNTLRNHTPPLSTGSCTLNPSLHPNTHCLSFRRARCNGKYCSKPIFKKFSNTYPG